MVEHWVPRVNIRRDLFGVIDVVAIGEQLIGIQVTSGSNVSSRIAKCTESPALPLWLKAGGRFQIHGWRKLKAGWQVRILEAVESPDGITFESNRWL